MIYAAYLEVLEENSVGWSEFRTEDLIDCKKQNVAFSWPTFGRWEKVVWFLFSSVTFRGKNETKLGEFGVSRSIDESIDEIQSTDWLIGLTSVAELGSTWLF